MKTWRNQFSLDWDISSIESELIKLGFIDSSWGNDVSPSFELDNNIKLRLWVDFQDIDLREFPDSKLFRLDLMDESFHEIIESHSSDQFDEIMDKIDDFMTRGIKNDN